MAAAATVVAVAMAATAEVVTMVVAATVGVLARTMPEAGAIAVERLLPAVPGREAIMAVATRR
jgi:hypothetical protein